jgi:peptidyl-prolyl cis-trans isomerase A (cyclophilin A)
MRKIIPVLLGLMGLICCKSNNQMVIITTQLGEIKLELYVKNAPATVNNFLHYTDSKRYTGAEFYRVVTPQNQPGRSIKIEVIQGGLEYVCNVDTIPGIPHETTVQTGIHHLDGTISMARNKPGSASTEFFICIGSQPELDFGGKRNPDGQGFAAFGRVVSGMDIVRKIQQMPADSNQVLLKRIKIFQIRRIK